MDLPCTYYHSYFDDPISMSKSTPAPIDKPPMTYPSTSNPTSVRIIIIVIIKIQSNPHPNVASGDDTSIGSSITGASGRMIPSQQSIMGAIGGAFGGLLSRRNKSTTTTPQHSSARPTISFDDDIWHESQQHSILAAATTDHLPTTNSSDSNHQLLRTSQSYSPAHANTNTTRTI